MKPRVLIVDDEPDYVGLIEFNLLRLGFEVATAFNGLEALRKARTEQPNAIILDLLLPDLDGFSICEILQAQPSTRDIPIILLSALDGDMFRKRGSQTRIFQYLTKGTDLHTLGQCIQAACAEQERRVLRHMTEEELD